MENCSETMECQKSENFPEAYKKKKKKQLQCFFFFSLIWKYTLKIISSHLCNVIILFIFFPLTLLSLRNNQGLNLSNCINTWTNILEAEWATDREFPSRQQTHFHLLGSMCLPAACYWTKELRWEISRF